MRKIILCCILILTFVFLSGCGRSSDRFTFSYEISTEEVSRGDRISITVTLTNDSDLMYIYKGGVSSFSAHERLYCNGYIIRSISADTDDGSRIHFVKPHQSSSRTFVYVIPDDAPNGDYNLRVGYESSEATYYKVFIISD